MGLQLISEQLSRGKGEAWHARGTSCPCTDAAATSAIVPLHTKGTLSLLCENSFPVVIFPVCSL